MRRIIFAFALLALAATAAQAGNAACTSQMVTGGFCPDTAHRLLFYAIPNTDPDGAGPEIGFAAELADAICFVENYQPTVEDGAPNPESCVQFADRRMKELLREIARRYRRALKDAEKQAELDAVPVPELP